MLKYEPAVFAVENSYQIMVMVETPSLMWIEIRGKRYYDETNGILRSKRDIHRITVPADELDRAKEYTVCEREIIERRAYFTESKEEKRYRFEFEPVTGKKGIRTFHIADTHSLRDEPVRAALAFGKTDFLILNGDILNHCENAEDFNIVYDIASAAAHCFKHNPRENTDNLFPREPRYARREYGDFFRLHAERRRKNLLYLPPRQHMGYGA